MTVTPERAASDDRVRSDDAGPRGTRERILAAARQIIVEEGYAQLSLQRVAERADVARATIYYQFGSKAGLLDGLVGEMEFEARIHESRDQDRTFGQLLRRVTRIWEDNRDVLRSVIALAAVESRTGQVIGRHDQGRRQRIAELVEQFDDAGKLGAERDDVVDALWLLTSFHAYDLLRRNTPRGREDICGLLEMLAAGIITPGDVQT